MAIVNDDWNWEAIEQDWPLPNFDRVAQGDFGAYWRSAGLHKPQRRLLKRVLERLMPWDSFLDVGCHVGPNLRVARGVSATARLQGLDRSGDYVAWGQRLSDASGLGAHYAEAYGETFDPEKYRSAVVLICHIAGVFPVQRAWTAATQALVVIGLPTKDVLAPLGLLAPSWVDQEEEHVATVVCRDAKGAR